MTHLAALLLLLVIIIISAKLSGALLTRLGQPAVFGEILIGLILGPTVLNILHLGIFQSSSLELQSDVHTLSQIGVILLMFVAGLETNLQEMKRVGNTAFWSAFGGVITTLAGTLFLAHQFHYNWSESLFIGAILTATSVTISARTLMELKQLKSKEGSTILGAAVIDDVIGLIVLSLVVAFAFQTGTSGARDILIICIQMTLFFILAIWLGNRFLEPVMEMLSKLPVSLALIAFVVGVVFLYAWAADYLGHLAGITGSYIAGILFAKTRFKKEIDAGILPITSFLFVPVFFVSIGLQANAREVGHNLSFLGMILLVAVAAKIIGCGLGARLTGFTNQESLRVGVGMISRGEVELIVAGYGLNHRIINQEIFSVMIIMVLFTTMITPLLLRFVFPKIVEVRSPVVFESVAHIEDKESEDL